MEVAKKARTVAFYKAGILTMRQPEVTDLNALSSYVSEQLLGVIAISEHPLAPGSS